MFMKRGAIALYVLLECLSAATARKASFPTNPALRFEPSVAPGEFVARGDRFAAAVRSAEARMILRSSDRAKDRVIRLGLEGARADQPGVGLGLLTGRSHYFLGDSPDQWRRDVSQYSRVRFPNVYPGIDVVYYGNGGELEYDMIVSPGADPSCIRLRLEGANKLVIGSRGDLVLHLEDGEIRHRRPVAYQVVNGVRRAVAARYQMRPDGSIAIRTGAWDRTWPLVIDPVLSHASYLGGNGLEGTPRVATDTAGNVYVFGSTFSHNFPSTPGVPQPNLAADVDVFIAKFNPAGSLVYSTFLGGARGELPRGIAVDAIGTVYLTGDTDSINLPIKNALQPGNRGGAGGLDAFVGKLSAAGSDFLYLTYLGGTRDDTPQGIAIDTAGNAYITGLTFSDNFPATPGAFQTTLRGFLGGFVTKINPSGSALAYSTYLSGSRTDAPGGIAVDATGAAYIVGDTASLDYPVTPGVIQTTTRGGINVRTDVFVTKLNQAGSALVYSTYLGGSGDDFGLGIAIDAAGNAYVTGQTASAFFPLTAGAAQNTLSGTTDAFVTKLNPTATAMVYSTFLGGSRLESGLAIAVDASGNAIVAGLTTSDNFPAVAAFQSALRGTQDAFIAKLNFSGTAVRQSSYLGGGRNDTPGGLALDGLGNAYVAGSTNSTDFPVTPRSFQGVYGGGNADAFLAKIGVSDAEVTLSVTQAQVAFQGTAGSAIPRQALSITSGSGRPNWIIELATTSGGNWLDASPRSGSGAATVNVSVDISSLAVGNYAGTLTLVNQFTLERVTVRVSLTLTAPASEVIQNAVLNAASFLAGPVTPGMIVTIFGNGIGPATLTGLRLTPAGLVDTLLAETRVFFDGVAAPLIYVSDKQVSVVAPYTISGKSRTQIQIEYRGFRSRLVDLPVAETAPAVFTADSSGRGQAAALNQDFTVNSAANPASKDSILILFVTGEGQTDPAGMDGKPAGDVLPKPRASVSVLVGGVAAEVLYAGAAPGFVAGVMQLNVRIPEGVEPGDVPAIVIIGGVASQAGVTIAVQ